MFLRALLLLYLWNAIITDGCSSFEQEIQDLLENNSNFFLDPEIKAEGKKKHLLCHVMAQRKFLLADYVVRNLKTDLNTACSKSLPHETPAVSIAKYGSAALVAAVEERFGVDVLCKKQGAWLSTPLHFAASEGRVLIVNQLLDDCDPNVQDMWGETPLMKAVRKDHLEAVKVLVRRSHTELRNLKRQTAIDLAQSKEIEDFLLYGEEAMANLSELNGEGAITIGSSHVTLLNKS